MRQCTALIHSNFNGSVYLAYLVVHPVYSRSTQKYPPENLRITTHQSNNLFFDDTVTLTFKMLQNRTATNSLHTRDRKTVRPSCHLPNYPSPFPRRTKIFDQLGMICIKAVGVLMTFRKRISLLQKQGRACKLIRGIAVSSTLTGISYVLNKIFL